MQLGFPSLCGVINVKNSLYAFEISGRGDLEIFMELGGHFFYKK